MNSMNEEYKAEMNTGEVIRLWIYFEDGTDGIH